MDLEAFEKHRPGFRIVKRYRGSFIEIEAVPIEFSGVKATAEVPPELAGLWAKVASGDVDGLDALDEFKALLKALDRKQVAAALLKP
ncbi:MAG TPA: hypothetical protein VI999_03810 [Thermoplasmata archaeon]|nr:hypothetical protein [Thermoplasmata archaeon]